ncbi:MAG: hypothetical protein JWP12_1176 [Bacteroidetes bacterium]|nr:hypothetical protein [Bacteroidota bacterium]
MKKNYSILIALFALTVGGNAQTESIETASWTPLISGTTNSLLGAAVVSTSECYVAGASGTIRKTTDGGTTWAGQITGTTQTLYSIVFTTSTTGYAVGDAGTALKTTNGGTTWTAMSLPVANDLRFVYFTDANTGYIAGGTSESPGIILKTINAGSSWTSLSTSSVFTDAAYGISFTSPTDGYSVDYDGNIIKTTNAGLTWTLLSSGTTTPLYAVCFPSINNGIVVSRAGDIRTTANAGASWSGVVSGTTDALTRIDFYDVNNVIAVGGNPTANTGTIVTTTNGGATWTVFNPGTQRLFGIDLFNANLGYAVGLGGTILKYTSNVGIHEYKTSALSLNSYPNPFSTSTTIDCGTYVFKNAASIEVYDLTGKLVKSTQTAVKANTIVIERDNLDKGIYLFKVYDGTTMIGTGKMIAE